MQEIKLDTGDEIWVYFEFKMPVGLTDSDNQLGVNRKTESGQGWTIKICK